MSIDTESKQGCCRQEQSVEVALEPVELENRAAEHAPADLGFGDRETRFDQLQGIDLYLAEYVKPETMAPEVATLRSILFRSFRAEVDEQLSMLTPRVLTHAWAKTVASFESGEIVPKPVESRVVLPRDLVTI